MLKYSRKSGDAIGMQKTSRRLETCPVGDGAISGLVYLNRMKNQRNSIQRKSVSLFTYPRKTVTKHNTIFLLKCIHFRVRHISLSYFFVTTNVAAVSPEIYYFLGDQLERKG